MANIKEQIINWFNGPQDYDQGIAFLQEVSRKNKVIAKLIRRGSTQGSFEKLVWELNKVAGLKKIPAPKAESPVKTASAKKKKTIYDGQQIPEKKEKFNLIGDKSLDSYPPEVNRLVKEYSSLYMQRGKKHAAIKRLGDGNDQATIDARKPLIDEIRTMSNRMEILNEAFQAYENAGKQIDISQLWPEEKKEGDEQNNIKPSENIENLKSQKKNIQSSLTKDRNLLIYGSKTKPKDGKERQMPAGPKRTTLEKRIARKEKDIQDLDQRIADLG
jgi:hypothetical protein